MEIDLLTLRKQIDKIDEDIVAKLDERFNIIKQIGELKRKNECRIYYPERETNIIERLNALDFKYLNKDMIKNIFREIFSISRNLEKRQTIAFLGPLGSYTYQAAHTKFGTSSEYVAFNNIVSIFHALERKQVDCGVGPIENSTNGIVGEMVDNLQKSDLKVVAELVIPICHSFATRANELKNIKRIYSKDIAFGQCREFLYERGLEEVERIALNSTAQAAQMAAEDEEGAAICSSIASKLYDVPVMFEEIQDHRCNRTRFFVISDFTNPPTGNDKTSAFASLKNFKEPAALFSLLRDFKDANINITKIDSRPINHSHNECGFGFYLDFKGHYEDENVKTIFAKRAHELKWLGSYSCSIEFM